MSGDAVFVGAMDSGVLVPISVSIMLSGFPREGLRSLSNVGQISCATDSVLVLIAGLAVLIRAEVKGFSEMGRLMTFSLIDGFSATAWCVASSIVWRGGD